MGDDCRTRGAKMEGRNHFLEFKLRERQLIANGCEVDANGTRPCGFRKYETDARLHR